MNLRAPTERAAERGVRAAAVVVLRKIVEPRLKLRGRQGRGVEVYRRLAGTNPRPFASAQVLALCDRVAYVAGQHLHRHARCPEGSLDERLLLRVERAAMFDADSECPGHKSHPLRCVVAPVVKPEHFGYAPLGERPAKKLRDGRRRAYGRELVHDAAAPHVDYAHERVAAKAHLALRRCKRHIRYRRVDLPYLIESIDACVETPKGDLMVRAPPFGAVEIGGRLLVPVPPLAYPALERTQARHLIAVTCCQHRIDIRYRSI